MTAAPIHLGGEHLLLDPLGVLFAPRLRLLAVADLHLEKGSAAARRGALLPPWDTRITLEKLARAIGRYRPETVVAVGDSFHDDDAPARLTASERGRLERIADGRRMVWVAGNHDRAPPAGLPGEAAPEWVAAPLGFRHVAGAGRRSARGTDGVAVEICGHHHPKAEVATRGGAVSRPCFVACASGRRLMLPAFGAYTGGLDVRSPALRSLFPRGGRVFLTGAERLYSFPFGLS